MVIAEALSTKKPRPILAPEPILAPQNLKILIRMLLGIVDDNNKSSFLNFMYFLVCIVCKF